VSVAELARQDLPPREPARPGHRVPFAASEAGPLPPDLLLGMQTEAAAKLDAVMIAAPAENGSKLAVKTAERGCKMRYSENEKGSQVV
jgi:hypothetical protein